MSRKSGVLLPVFSLPSPYGIGDLGEKAYRFVDFLKASGQTLWQVLPIHPTSVGDSPYQSPSAFAGNPYFISLDKLCADGLLTADELPEKSDGAIDYLTLYNTRRHTLAVAVSRFDTESGSFLRFCRDEGYWLDDYALFASLKEHFMCPYTKFPDELKFRDENALNEYRERLGDEITYHKVTQYLFFSQWFALKKYANERGIRIIGDIPLYVASDSADVWANPTLFHLDENACPKVVAGVPPDIFCVDGQRWGNPIYNYSEMAKDGYMWWRKRIFASSRLYDTLRIDHFLGITRYWEIPFTAPTAADGVWRNGPGDALLTAIDEERGNLSVIAEDLGVYNPDSDTLRRRHGYMGMKVLLFMDESDANPFVPYRFTRDSAVYVGTHDNDTALGFANEGTDSVKFIMDYTNAPTKDALPDAFVRLALSSVCDTAIIAIQDWLGLDEKARINIPGTVGNSWRWRLYDDMLSKELSERMFHLTKLYGR